MQQEDYSMMPKFELESLEQLKSGNWPNKLKLNLNHQNMGDEGAKAIADLLKSGNCPTGFETNLEYNQISDEGAKAIIDALQSGKCPLELKIKLQGNKLSQAYLTEIDYLLEKNNLKHHAMAYLKSLRIKRKSQHSFSKVLPIKLQEYIDFLVPAPPFNAEKMTDSTMCTRINNEIDLMYHKQHNAIIQRQAAIEQDKEILLTSTVSFGAVGVIMNGIMGATVGVALGLAFPIALGATASVIDYCRKYGENETFIDPTPGMFSSLLSCSSSMFKRYCADEKVEMLNDIEMYIRIK